MPQSEEFDVVILGSGQGESCLRGGLAITLHRDGASPLLEFVRGNPQKSLGGLSSVAPSLIGLALTGNELTKVRLRGLLSHERF
jgi:hypothetical protein